jgi:hypothetical protein
MKYTLLLILTILISSCKYQTTFNQVKSLESLKVEVESVASQELNADNQEKLRAYFSSIKDIAYKFMTNSKMQKYTHKKFMRFFQDSICEDILVDESTYRTIMKKCSVSGFYICSEEVKSYLEILKEVKKLFKSSELKKITSNKRCESKLKKLGVINE